MLWYNAGNHWKDVSLARADMKGDAYLVCPGPSLADIDAEKLRGRGRKVFAINTAYPKVKPDVWMGMDRAECYDPEIWAEPFMKIVRGNYTDMQAGGEPIKNYDNVYFADVKEPAPGKTMLDYRNHNDPLVWHNNTLAAMLHLIIWMGGKRIYLVGCDMGGKKDYYDDRELPPEQREYNRKLYKAQISFIKALSERARSLDVQLISSTPDTPLNSFLQYIPIEEAISESERKATVEKTEIKHALDAERKVAVITPTRGDRPQLIRAWRKMMDYQTVRPDKVYLIDRKPKIEGEDQRERIHEGVELAKKDGITHIIIMEDDDYYPPDYIEKVLGAWGTQHIIGGYYYPIYHLKDRNRVVYNMDMKMNTGIVAPPLNSTAFTVKFWDSFMQGDFAYTERNLDLEMWKWAHEINTPYKFIYDPDLMISIKHGIGKVAGGNHSGIKEGCAVADNDMRWLTKAVHPDILEIYKQL